MSRIKWELNSQKYVPETVQLKFSPCSIPGVGGLQRHNIHRLQ